ncbi:MAG: hypothetical protein ACOYD1_00340 [Candidatus Nanopelagicales bacterium]
MVRVFVRLKLTLLRASFSASTATAVVFIVGALVALLGGIFMGALLAVSLSPGQAGGAVLPVVLFAGVWIMWVVGPLLNSAQGDQSIDPSRLELLPLSNATQVRGLLVSGFVGPGALGTIVGAAGAIFAMGFTPLARIGALVCALLFVTLCVAWSRTASAVFAGVLNSRRGRDLTIALSAFIGIGVYVISQQLNKEALALTSSGTTGDFRFLAILPPAALGLALTDLRDGDLLTAALLMAWGAIGIGISLWIWRWALARRLDGGGAAMSAKAKRGPVGDSVLYPVTVKWLPHTDLGATIAKEIRYYLFRSTLQLQQLVLGSVVAVLVAGQSLFSSAPSPLTDFLGAFVLFMVLWQSAPNVFGIDNSAVSVYILTGVRMGSVVMGKMLALLLIGLPIAIIVQIAAASVHGRWSTLPIGLAVPPIPWLVWLGLGSQLSVRAGYPLVPGVKPNSARAVTAVLGGLVGSALLVVIIVAAGVGANVLIGTPWAGVGVAWILGLAVGYFGWRNAAAKLGQDATPLLAELEVSRG